MESTATVFDFFDAWELFRDATLTGMLAGMLLGVIGVYVVLRRMVFLSAAISQTASLGVALSFYAKIHWGFVGVLASPNLWGTAITLIAVLLVARDRPGWVQRRDAILGFVFLVGSAGTLAVGTRIVEEVHDIQTILFGTAVAVLPEDYSLVLWLTVGSMILHATLWRGFLAVTYDRLGARVRGLPVNLLDILLFTSLALTVAVCTKILGALPAFAFSILPALAATQISPNVKWVLFLSGVFGAVSGFGGYVVAFLYEFPVGASQAGMASCLTVVSFGIRRVSKLAK